jgi:hypothetical protein
MMVTSLVLITRLVQGATLDIQKGQGDSLTIGARLKAAGVSATQNDDGTLSLTLQDGRQVTGSISEDGNIRYFGPPGEYSGGTAGLYQIDILNGTTREVAPDETSDFGVASQFGGNISSQTEAGRNYTLAYQGKNLGKYDYINPASAISTLHDFSGRGTTIMGSAFQGGLSGLQGGMDVKAKIAEEAQRRAAALAAPANIAQGATAFDLNTTPVRQVAYNGQPVKQLKVTPVKAPTIGKVTVAQPQKKLTVAPVKTGLSLGKASGGFLQGGGL